MAITKKQSAELARQAFEYAPAPEAIDHVKIQPRYGLFIGGRMVEAHSKKHFPTINPATEKPLSQVVDADEVDVDRAVKAAGKAFDSWARLSPSRRSRYLFRISRLLQERSRELAVVETMDGGKPIKESRDVDIPLSAAHFFYYAGSADKLEWAFPNRKPSPLGVAGQVIPWNFPLLMLAWKIAPALAAGNTVVLKPAETTPLSAMLFAEICMQAELPPGVVNIVTGAGKTGSLVVSHPGVKKVAFTGSTEVGKLIQRAIAGSGKRLTLELGGKAANIVFDDAPLDQAVEGIVNGIYFNQGHVCCAGSRLLVQESIAEPLLEMLKRRLSTLRLGDPLDKNTDIGAINSRAQLEKIQGLVESGIEEGAELYQPECVLPDRGFWFPPSLFTNVAQSYRIAREEIFGPVLSVLTFRTPNEAVEKANNTPYGLSAGVWTDKGSRILWMAERMRAGVVWANTFNRFDPTSPFGGYKESGFGRAAEFVELLGGGVRARRELERSFETLVWYAGWTDKLPQVTGTVNPVAGPYFNFTIPEPTGVVAIVAPERDALSGLVRRLAPVLCGGNVVVALTAESQALAPLTVAEVLLTSDVPAGVVNIISVQPKDLLPWLSSHMDINAIDTAGCTTDEIKAIEESAAGNVKRVIKLTKDEMSPYLISAFMEMKTVWHPIGV